MGITCPAGCWRLQGASPEDSHLVVSGPFWSLTSGQGGGGGPRPTRISPSAQPQSGRPSQQALGEGRPELGARAGGLLLPASWHRRPTRSVGLAAVSSPRLPEAGACPGYREGMRLLLIGRLEWGRGMGGWLAKGCRVHGAQGSRRHVESLVSPRLSPPAALWPVPTWPLDSPPPPHSSYSLLGGRQVS